LRGLLPQAADAAGGELSRGAVVEHGEGGDPLLVGGDPLLPVRVRIQVIAHGQRDGGHAGEQLDLVGLPFGEEGHGGYRTGMTRGVTCATPGGGDSYDAESSNWVTSFPSTTVISERTSVTQA
ncbi:MAG: hypothetical protein ACK56I_26315, partial [bacterium]